MADGARRPGDFLPPFKLPSSALGRSGLAALFRPEVQGNVLGDLAAALSARSRTRAHWNARFIHWEKPASVTEAGTIERARSLVAAAVGGNSWLGAEQVRIEGQGSYFNNTNVRTEADIDLRIVHPNLKVDFADNVEIGCARTVLGFGDAALTYEQIFTGLRTNLARELRLAFGASNIKFGKKAIRIAGITGSRAEVDVVPAVRYQWIVWLPQHSRYETLEGIAILATDGQWTVNFPDQHARNAIAKRQRTAHRFKKVVRIFKRLASEMAERQLLAKRVPSFLVESLVYAVEDEFFLVESDDRYDRVCRVARRMHEQVANPFAASQMVEINDLKRLFAGDQAWSYAEAKAFADAAVAHLANG